MVVKNIIMLIFLILLLLPLPGDGAIDITKQLLNFQRVSYTTQGRRLRHGEGRLDLRVGDTQLGVSLKRDDDIFPPGYQLLIGGDLVPVPDPDVDCIYRGPNTTFSFCHGGLSGSHHDRHFLNSESEGLVSFTDSDLIEKPAFGCGTPGGEDEYIDPPLEREGEYEIGASSEEGGKIKYVKLLLVSDLRRFQNHGSRDSMMQHTKAIVAQLKQIYSTFPNAQAGYFIQLQVVGIISIETGGKDPWGAFNDQEVNPTDLLRAFNTWRSSMLGKLPEHGVAHLLSGYNFAGTIVGLSGVDTICSTSWAAGINQATDPNDNYVAKILAHELGHTLGFRHTNAYQPGSDISIADTAVCSKDPTNVMQPMIYSSNYHWESCSPKWFRMRFEGFPYNCEQSECTYKKVYGYRYAKLCMETPSRDVFTSASCGNGILDPGEECDDLSKCCERCKLRPGARCSIHQGCCDPETCLPTTHQGQVCRVSRGPCDVPEYCDGTGASCPPDLRNKTCTHNQQCLFLLGRYSNILGECPRAGDLNLIGDLSCGPLYCLRRTDLYCESGYRDDSRNVIMVEDGTPCQGGEGVCRASQCFVNNTRVPSIRPFTLSPTRRPTSTKKPSRRPTRRPSRNPTMRKTTPLPTSRPTGLPLSITGAPTPDVTCSNECRACVRREKRKHL